MVWREQNGTRGEEKSTRRDIVASTEIRCEQAEDMRGYDSTASYKSGSYGLVNIGAICWFNSLIQTIISAPQFISAIRSSNEPESTERDGEALSVINAFKQFLKSVEEPRAVHDASPILIALTKIIPNFGTRQEDAHEGFHLLIDKMPEAISKVFESSWRVDLYCDSCRKIVSNLDNQETMIQVTVEQEFIPLNLDGDSFAQYMSGHMTELQGYKCPKCQSVGKAMRIARLVRPANVLVVSFNKYTTKWDGPAYTNDMSIKYLIGPQKYSEANYMLVGAIRHYGNAYGGHYNATALRADGPGLFDDTRVVPAVGWKQVPEDYMLIYALK